MLNEDHLVAASSIRVEAAEAAVTAARDEAERRGVAVSIAVLDRGGHLVHFTRMNGIHVGTAAVSIAKAKTSVLYNRATSTFGAGLTDGNLALLALPELIPLPGGVPLTGPDGLAGAIGVSGAAPEVDEAIALAGAAAGE